jgi:hypothetical protein
MHVVIGGNLGRVKASCMVNSIGSLESVVARLSTGKLPFIFNNRYFKWQDGK